MKVIKKILTIAMVFALLFNSMAAFASGESNDDSENNNNDSENSNNEVIDELWGVPILAHGASLDDAQLAEVHTILGLTNRTFDSVPVTGSDVVHFLGVGNANTGMYSSALITRNSNGTGIEVSILTPDNITRVTETQYANAMVTAGVTDAHVEVAAPFPVTGEAALTGIYKAFSERGIDLDDDRMAVAQEQLLVTSGISNYHDDNDDFNSYQLDQAVIDIQAQLADIYQKTGELATQEQIIEITQSALEKSNLEDIITPEQIQQIAGFASNFQLTDAINSTEFRDQLSNLSNRVGNLVNNVDRGVVSGWWNRLVNWLGNIFN